MKSLRRLVNISSVPKESLPFHNGPDTHSWGATDVWEDGKLTESMGVDLFSKSKPHWSHSVNAYYNGDFGKWNINFNGDFYNKVSQSTQTAINDGKLDAEFQSP